MSPRPEGLTNGIAAAAAYVRRHAGLALIAAVLGAAALALLVTWVLGAAWVQPTPLPLLIDLAVLAGAAGVLLYWRRVLRPRLDSARVAAATEARHGLPAGTLRGLLELHAHVPEGTSPALAARAERLLAARLAGENARSLAGDLGDGWFRRARATAAVLGVGVLLLGTLAFAAPERTRAGWTPLLHPVKQLRPPPLPALEVHPGNAEVQRGEDLVVRVRAAGRDAVLLRWRLQGDIVREQVLALSGDSTSGIIADVSAAGEYWIEAPDGAESPRFTLTPIDALLLSGLTVDVLYPAYLSLTPDHYEGDLPLLEVPEGTTLRITGRATRPLTMAALQGSRGAVPFRVRERELEGRWTPSESGLYTWIMRDASGAGLAVAPAPVEILLVPDAAPTVDLTFPGVDTLLGPDMRQALAADARDDHGLASAVLVSWKVSGSGEREAPVETALPLEQLGDRVLLRTVLDAGARGLVPGDTLKYFVRVTDTSPARQTGVSATHTLRLPTADELRDRAQQQAQDALTQAEALTKRAAEIEKQTRNAERNAQAGNARRSGRNSSGGQPGEDRSKMQFQETQEARRVLEQQQALMQQVEQLRGSLEALEKSMAEAGLRDQELQRKLEELRELYDKLLTPEMRRQLEELQKSVQELSPEQMEKALERLAEQQKQMQAQLEKSLEMMQRAAAEQEMNALSQEAKELSAQQEALAREHEREQSPEKSKERAGQQEQLAKQGEQLGREMGELGKQLEQQGETQASERTQAAAAQTGEAQQQMEQAAESAAAQHNEEAAKQGRQAAEKLRQAAERLDDTRRQMTDGARQQAEESMQQATRDALSLAQRQQELQQQMQASAGQQQQQQQQGGQQGQQQPQTGQQQGQQGQSARQPGQQQSQQQGNQQGGQRPKQGGGEQEGPQRGSGQGQSQQSGGQQGAGGGKPDLAQMQAQQGALQQGLEQLGRNLSETSQQSGMVNQDVGAAMNRAHSAMQQTQQGLQQAQQSGQLPTEQAASAVDALNRLALSLLNNTQQIQQSQGGNGGTQQALQQLADLAKQQGSVNGQSGSLQELGLSQGTLGEQARRLGQDQQQIAQKLGGMNNMVGGREDVLGEIDALAKEADAIARELQGGRLPPEVRARQERLFHRLLDAGRSLEREETSEERTAERPGEVAGRAAPGALDPRLLDTASRYRVPTPDELRALPPAYRRLILDYFERLNRPAPPTSR